MKFHVRTYGCQMNVADSGEMGRHLQARVIEPTGDPDQATLLLVNTCTVRQHAEDRALSEIGKLKRWKARRAGRMLVVTGCAAERTREFLERRFPHIDRVIGARSIESFPEIIDGLLGGRVPDEDLEYPVPADGKVSAFVTIMRGCNYSCTYCIVPSVRGRERYRPMDAILREVRQRVEDGVREITLLGQTVNSYHRNGTTGRSTEFAELLQAVAGVGGVERIRFISPHPYYMTDRLIDAMAAIESVCEWLHLPVQSGSDAVLGRMLRNYTRERYLRLIEKFRRAMTGMTLSTDIIVGFPGETEDDFLETLSLVEEAQFDWGFIFKYSPREGTPARGMAGLPHELIEERHQECLYQIERIGARKRARLLGTVQEVLVEQDRIGRTRTNYKVEIDGAVRAGHTVPVRITNADRITLRGSPAKP